MTFPDDRVTRVVSSVAMLVALVAAVALPAVYGVIAYLDLAEQLEFKAKVKATALSGLISTQPDVWVFAENRLQGLLTREPVPLDGEKVEVFDDRGDLVTSAGPEPRAPVLRRFHLLYDATRNAGRIEVSKSLRPLIWGFMVAAAGGLLLGAMIFTALRTLPLRALRRVTDALFEQKQRAEVTLHSIGDAVITTDAKSRVEFMNPMAERLSGWTFERARDRPLLEVLHLVDAISGQMMPGAIPAALAENRSVSFGREIDLLRPDGSRIGIEDSAAPIHDPDGRVTGGVLIFRDVSTARGLARQRSWEASHDSLTGLPNRREFERLVGQAVQDAGQEGKQHVLCYLDLDQFKVINDTCGHAAGDDLLRRAAAMLSARIRVSDTLARLGGDEFGLLLDNCPLERAELVAADLLAAVRDFRYRCGGKVFSIGVSVGMAVVQDDCSVDEAIGMADTACCWAKEQGRDRVCVYRRGDSDLDARRRQVGWVSRINAALVDERFVLYGQEYRRLTQDADNAIHLEVLLRMVDDDGGVIPPGSFLPAAERYNLMPSIDRWVVRRVFAGYHELRAARGDRPLTCAINLSATTINSEGFFDFVRQQALDQGMPAGSICFEITESSAINNLRHAVEFMRQCKALGFLFALDDFGTGMSSFGYLKDLPVDYLKIDGSFVRNLAHDPVDRAMTEAINRIGHIMGLETVAEYAEDEAIIDQLRRIGVDYAQGFGVCRPSPLLGPMQKPLAGAATESFDAGLVPVFDSGSERPVGVLKPLSAA